MISLYVIPVNHPPGHNVPRYLSGAGVQTAVAGLESVTYAWVAYHAGDVGVIACNLDVTQDGILSSQPGVFPIPNLDATVPNANVRNQIQSQLESSNVPGLWVATGMAYRIIVRRVIGELTYHNRVLGIAGTLIFDGTRTLDSTVSQLSSIQQAAAIQAAADLGLIYTATGATTLRALIENIGIQKQAVPYEIRGAGIVLVI